MATDPEALSQLSRLLGEALPPPASRADVHAAIERRFQRLADGLLAEAAASDDVIDRDSAFEFLDARLADLKSWLSPAQASRLRASVRGKIEAW
jgi:hypothetical protein